MVAEIRKKNQITIPKKVISELGLEEGDLLEFDVKDGQAVVTPVVVYPKSYIKKLEENFDEAKADLESGAGKKYSSAKEMLEDIKKVG